MRAGDEIWFWLVMGLIGFFLGGIIGAVWLTGFFPAAWYGLGIAWGLPICFHCLDCH